MNDTAYICDGIHTPIGRYGARRVLTARRQLKASGGKRHPAPSASASAKARPWPSSASSKVTRTRK